MTTDMPPPDPPVAPVPPTPVLPIPPTPAAPQPQPAVTPIPGQHMGVDPSNYKLRWTLSVVAWVVGLLLAIVKAVQELMPTLGWSPAVGTDFLVAGVILAAIGGAIQTFPTAPDAARLGAERTLHWQRKAVAAARLPRH